ncbi:MAG: AbrB/MazE/SpoVT family DNA-binding domain-containing protein [Rubrobacteraceae bacterium]
MKVKVTKDGLLIPKEVAERLGSDEVEVFEEPGRLLIVAGTASPGRVGVGSESQEDPILGLGRNPVRTGVRDGSTNHDRYLYDAGD